MPPRTAMTDRGFTLLEVLIAAVVLTTGLLLAFQGVTAGAAASRRSARRAAARSLAADILTLAAADAAAVPSSGSDRREGVEYAWRLAWDTASPTASKAVCRVEWIDRGDTHSVSLSRLIFSRAGTAP